MNIIILSKSEYLYTTQAIKNQLSIANFDVEIINPLECNVKITSEVSEVLYNQKSIKKADYVIPRIGAASDSYGLYVLNALERNNIKTLNSSESIKLTRDKFNIYTTLTDNNLPVPKTILVKTVNNPEHILKETGGFPVIVKLTRGSQGKGVMIAENMNTLKGIIDSFSLFEENIILQEYIETTPRYSDIRLYILNNKVIGATQRINYNDFRSNIHCNGQMMRYECNNELIELSLKAAECFKLNFCTVDFLIRDKEIKILEINSTPGFEGAEKQTDLNLSKILTNYIKEVSGLSSLTK